MNYNGFYINLDRSTDRRGDIEKQIAHYRWEELYSRFPAADGNILNFPNTKLFNGEMGCFTSHYLVLKQNLAAENPIHVIEDDVIFASCMVDAIRSIIQSKAFDDYDIVYTDTLIPSSSSSFRTNKLLFDKIVTCDENGRIVQAEFQLINMEDKFFGTTSSFLVNPKSIRKLHDLYEAELTKGPDLPIDLFLRDQAGKGIIKVGCLFPFVTSILWNHIFDSTINLATDDGLEKLYVLSLNVARYSFFVDRDLPDCYRMISKLLPLPEDLHLKILMHIMGLFCTDRFSDTLYKR